jgi:hypothetical protein
MERRLFSEEKKETEDLRNFLNRNMSVEGKDEEKRAALVRLKQLEQEALERLQQASRVAWTENDEKSTSFFYNRLKQGQANSNIVSLQVNDRTLPENEVNNHIHSFYSTLYKSKTNSHWPADWNTDIDRMKNLTEAEISSLGKPLTLQELKLTLFRGMKEGKAPGNDGLTVGLYKSLWQLISTPLINCMEEAIAKAPYHRHKDSQ